MSEEFRVLLEKGALTDLTIRSVSNSQGDPFEGRSWNVTSDGATPDVCSHTGIYDTNVHACQDQSVTLTLSMNLLLNSSLLPLTKVKMLAT